jgi:hypothetical protein
MKYGKWLIDEALKMCETHTRYELSKRTGLAESHLSAVYNGKKPVSVPMAQTLAAVAGIDPGQAVLRALAERAGAKKPPMGALGVVATLLISYGIGVTINLAPSGSVQSGSTLYASYLRRLWHSARRSVYQDTDGVPARPCIVPRGFRHASV